MWHTILFTLVSTPPLVIIPLFFAIVVNRIKHGQWFFRLAFFLPYILPSAVIALIWTWLYEPGYGLIDGFFHLLGLGAPGWLSSPNLALYSIVIVTVWWTIGFNFVLYLAGLQDIPRDLYEASALDGAGRWKQTWRLTIPMLGRTITLVTVLQIIASLKIFDQVYLITAGGPNYATRTAIEYIYDTGFTASGSVTRPRRHWSCSWSSCWSRSSGSLWSASRKGECDRGYQRVRGSDPRRPGPAMRSAPRPAARRTGGATCSGGPSPGWSSRWRWSG